MYHHVFNAYWVCAILFWSPCENNKELVLGEYDGIRDKGLVLNLQWNCCTGMMYCFLVTYFWKELFYVQSMFIDFYTQHVVLPFFFFISREQKVSESYLLCKWYRLLQNFNDWTLSFFDLRTWILNTEHCTCFLMCYVVYWLWSHLLNHDSKDTISNGWF